MALPMLPTSQGVFVLMLLAMICPSKMLLAYLFEEVNEAVAVIFEKNEHLIIPDNFKLYLKGSFFNLTLISSSVWFLNCCMI